MCRLKSTGFFGGHRSDLWDPLVAGDKENMVGYPWNWRMVPRATSTPSCDSSHQKRVSVTYSFQQAGCLEMSGTLAPLMHLVVSGPYSAPKNGAIVPIFN